MPLSSTSIWSRCCARHEAGAGPLAPWHHHTGHLRQRLAVGCQGGRLRHPHRLPGGSCGACEIDVNGTTVRACIATVPGSRSGELSVELASDPYW